MENFAKSILNYFAAFNETRFRFTTRAAQKWLDNELTLDFSVFPEFEKELLDQLQNRGKISVEIAPGTYAISLDQDEFSERLTVIANEFCTSASLAIVREELERELPAESELDHTELYRAWNLRFRKLVGNLLVDLQEDKKQELISDLNIDHLPLSTLNTTSIEQDIFGMIKNVSNTGPTEEAFIDQVKAKLLLEKPALVMYDLYSLILSFHRLTSSNTVHLFLHELIHQECSYPLATTEVQLQAENGKYSLRTVRDLVQLNTPAVNSTKMGKVLTTPRACSVADLPSNIAAIEMYFQAYFHNTSSFFFQPHFKKLVGKDLPTIAPRIGLQIVEKEDRKLLDYSELITNIDSGPGKKFVDLVTEYVDGNIEHHTTYAEVNAEFNAEYPTKSPKQFFSDIPLALNSNQKKILTAAKNPNNRVMRIDGPPGTGKSYTITALVYLANLLNKTVLITSHKPQALDVVEEKLTEQFRQIHPYAKPPILRLTKPDESTLNSVENTLSDGVINQTLNRSSQVNIDVIAADLERIEKQFGETIADNWVAGAEQYQQLEKIGMLATLAQQLSIPIETRTVDEPISLDTLRSLIGSLANVDVKLNVAQYSYISDNISKIEEWKQALAVIHNTAPATPVTTTVSQSALVAYCSIIDRLAQILDGSVTLGDCNFESAPVLPNLSELARSLSPSKLDEAVIVVEQLHKLNKQLTTKLFGNEDKRRISHALSLDFPEIYTAIEKDGPEKVLFGLQHDQSALATAKQTLPWLSKEYLLKQEPALASVRELFESLTVLEFADLSRNLCGLLGKNMSQCSITELKQAGHSLEDSNASLEAYHALEPLAVASGLSVTDTSALQRLITATALQQGVFSPNAAKQLTMLHTAFPELLNHIGVTMADVQSLRTLFDDSDQAKQAREYLEIYLSLKNPRLVGLQTELLQKQQEKRLRLLVQQNEHRFSELNQHPNEIQKILTAMRANQRLTTDQARVLLQHIPCIIAPPDLISQFFPMEADMLDWLIIDEASQVSIAESLSLMLRAKQTIVFGDELQYGAVGATNVSIEYSKEYFRNVLDDYVKDKHEQIDDSVLDQIATDVSQPVEDDDVTVSPSSFQIDPNTKEWLKTFSIRTSTLDFAKAIRNYSDSLTVHFRSYPEIISYSNDYFYKPSEINLVTSRIRTKPITQVIDFIKVTSKGLAGNNINLDEIESIKDRLELLFNEKYRGSIGIICSFREQTDRMKDVLRRDLPCYSELVEKNGLKIWFVGDVQGEERDIVLYSFVEDKAIGNANLSTIYPVVGGVADNIRNLRMQRLNVGFSRAKDMMVFVHSMELKEYKGTRLGDALEHYWKVLHSTTDNFITDLSLFGSPREEFLYSLIIQTDFYHRYQDNIRLIAQFEIGKYLKEEYRRYIPDYRVDFLLTLTAGHVEHPLIIEYDGLEFHTNNPHGIRTAADFDQEYIEYDIQRQLELESYGYRFLRFNKFSLAPPQLGQTEVDVVNKLLYSKMDNAINKLEICTQVKPQPPAPQMLREESPAYYSASFKSPMEEKLDGIIRHTAFFDTHKDHIQLMPNFDIKNDIKGNLPAHMPSYKVDFLLTVGDEMESFKLIIEYDGVKYHTYGSEEINSADAMDRSLSDDHVYRQYDLEELGYRLLRLNKFILFDRSRGKDPIEIVDELLNQEFDAYRQRTAI